MAVCKTLSQLYNELGFGSEHPNRPTATLETELGHYSLFLNEGKPLLCSVQAYGLARHLCEKTGPGLWPNTIGRHWPSWPEESELILKSVAHLFFLKAFRRDPKKRKFLHEHQTRLAEPRRIEAQSAVQHRRRPAVQSSNNAQLSDSLGFGWKHPGRPEIKVALRDAGTPTHHPSICSDEAYDLAIKFCDQKALELWPNTNGRRWPSWAEDSELIVESVAHFLSLKAYRLHQSKLRRHDIPTETDLDMNVTGAITNTTSEKNAPFTYSRGQFTIEGQYYEKHIKSHVQKAKLRASCGSGAKKLAWWKAQCRFRGLNPEGTILELATSLVGHEEDPIPGLDQIFDPERYFCVDYHPDILGIWSGLSCLDGCWMYSETRTFSLYLHCKLLPVPTSQVNVSFVKESNFALSIKAVSVSGNEVKLRAAQRTRQVDASSSTLDILFHDIQLEQAPNYFNVIIQLEWKSARSWVPIASRTSTLITVDNQIRPSTFPSAVGSPNTSTSVHLSTEHEHHREILLPRSSVQDVPIDNDTSIMPSSTEALPDKRKHRQSVPS